MANYYELLGITPDATVIQIRSAYTRDLLGLEKSTSPNSARFRAALEEAVETLLDPEKRSAYDAQLRAKKVKPPKAPKAPKAPKPAKVPKAATIAAESPKSVKTARATALPAEPSQQASGCARNGGLAFALGGLISAITYVASNGTYLLAWAPLVVGSLGLAWWLVRYVRIPRAAWRPDHILLLGGMILFGLVSAGWVGLTGTTP